MVYILKVFKSYIVNEYVLITKYVFVVYVIYCKLPITFLFNVINVYNVLKW